MPSSRREVLLLALITLVAASLRVYKLGEIPPGLAGDTAYKGVAADRILAGDHPIYFEESWGGIEPMYMYLLAGLFKLLGSTPLAIKMLSAIIGIITVPLLYLVARDLFHSRGTGLLASVFLAISYWHVSYSRLGWEIILGPPFVILTVYLLWRALKTSRWRDSVWAGLTLGASLYTYQALRFLPVLVVCYVGYRGFLEKGFWRSYGPKFALCLGIALLVFAPLGLYFVTNSDAFLRRASEVSIFNPEKNPQGPLRSFVESGIKVLGTYNFRGDPLWRHNLPGRPAFDLPTSLLFFAGLAVSLANWRKREHSLLLFWLVVLTLPPILTPPRDVPHFSRSIGALPAACIVSAIGLVTAWQWFRGRQPSQRARVVAGLCMAGIVVLSATLTARDYFDVWASNPALREDYFDGQFVDLATTMNRLDDPEGVWILPITAPASPHDEPGHHTVEFLYRGEAPFHFLRLDPSTVASDLTSMTRGRDKALLVDYKSYVLSQAYNYIDADPKQLASFLLEKYSDELQTDEFESFDVHVYSLRADTAFSIADSWQELKAEFGDQLELTGISLGVAGTGEQQTEGLPSGKKAWVVLRWQTLSQPTSDYKVALLLLDQRDRVVGQVDKLLLSSQMGMTSRWHQGEVELDYYLLPSLPGTPPGNYDLQVVVYDPHTTQRLMVYADTSTKLADRFAATRVRIERPVSAPMVQPMYQFPAGDLTSDLALLGYDLAQQSPSPGDRIEIALYWKALQDINADYVVQLQLRDNSARSWAEEESRPAYGTYPSNLWKRGEVVRDWHELRVPADAPSGDYSLQLTLEADSAPAAEVELGTIHVSGRARSFDMPVVEHRLDWRLGDDIKLLGYDLERDVEVGDPLRVTLYWQCLSEMSQTYTVFTHVLDSNDVIRGQIDRVPGVPTMRTTSWIRGEVIADPYEIPLDPEAPPGRYAVEIGMYDSTTMERLPVFNAQGEQQGDSIMLEIVTVDE
jgi:4-amino-4-deoxy-L-arabinose transferase-like glycosyltransferase